MPGDDRPGIDGFASRSTEILHGAIELGAMDDE
jgi:hypothetical protein